MNTRIIKKENDCAIQITKRLTNKPLLIDPKTINTTLSLLNGPIGLAHLSFPDKINISQWGRFNGLIRHGNVGVIAIKDILYNHSDFIFENLLTGTSYDTIRSRFQAALNDPSISAIVFDCDSPGGEVSGCFDLVDEIYNARGTKPIYAVVNEMAYSGAYAIASAADKIFVPRTAGVGSVGVIYLHMDQSKYDENIGVKYTPIYAGSHKVDFDRHLPLSAEAQRAAREEINRIYELFITTVSRNRAVSSQSVRNTEAALYFGKNAVDAGLADSVMSWSKALSDISLEYRTG